MFHIFQFPTGGSITLLQEHLLFKILSVSLHLLVQASFYNRSVISTHSAPSENHSRQRLRQNHRTAEDEAQTGPRQVWVTADLTLLCRSRPGGCSCLLLAQHVKGTGEARSTQPGCNTSHDPFLLYFKVRKTNCPSTECLSSAEIPRKSGELNKWEGLSYNFLEQHIPVETTEFCCSCSVSPFQELKNQYKSTA